MAWRFCTVATVDVERYRKLAKKLNLKMSGGSDFHFDDHDLGNFMQ